MMHGGNYAAGIGRGSDTCHKKFNELTRRKKPIGELSRWTYWKTVQGPVNLEMMMSKSLQGHPLIQSDFE